MASIDFFFCAFWSVVSYQWVSLRRLTREAHYTTHIKKPPSEEKGSMLIMFSLRADGQPCIERATCGELNSRVLVTW